MQTKMPLYTVHPNAFCYNFGHHLFILCFSSTLSFSETCKCLLDKTFKSFASSDKTLIKNNRFSVLKFHKANLATVNKIFRIFIF